jgi:hypothetical protein
MDRAQLLALYEKRRFCLQGAKLRRATDTPDVQRQLLEMKDLPTDARARQERLDGYQRAFAHIDEAERQCNETPEQMGDGSIYELALRAADSGDAEAAICYVTGHFPAPAAMLRRPDLRARYAINASRLLEQGIQAGDWRMVLIGALVFTSKAPEQWQLRLPDDPLDSPELALTRTIAPEGDPLRGYRMWKLLALGDAQKNPDDNDASVSISAYYAKHVSAAQRREADAWAQQTFQRAFHGRGPESNKIQCK